MPKTIYALLVGINKYAPASGVSRLYGCVKDVEAMQQFLLENYPAYNPQIELLINGCATRVNIIDTFDSHLIQQAKTGDTVLFYYSGHGSYAKTAPEFADYDLQAQDETFVCYDSRLPGRYDLADKEIAVLLSKIKPEVHTVVIADSCHADSITRGDGIEATQPEISRHCPARHNETPRDLSTYFLSEADNYYLQQKRAGKKVSIPSSKHTVISACNRNQSAKEKFQRGVFSYHLLATLKKTGQNINYTQLFQYTNAAVVQDTYQQLPNLSSYDNFDLRKTFLLDDIIQSTTPFLVTYDKEVKEWSLDHGAIYGLNTTPEAVKSLQVGIYQQGASPNIYDLLATVPVKAVKLKTCYLDFSHVDTTGQFRAAFLNAQASTLIYLNGTTQQKQAFEAVARQHQSPFIAFTPFKDKVTLELQITENDLSIVHPETGELIHGCIRDAVNAIPYIVDKLRQIDKYETLVPLDNPHTKLDRSAIEFRFVVKEEGESIPYNHQTIKLNRKEGGLDFYLELKNNFSKDLYVGIYHFSPQFKISTFYKCDKLPKLDTGQAAWKKIQDSKDELFMDIFDEAAASVTDYFKLFISTAPFNDYKFTEDNELKRAIIFPPSQTRGMAPRGQRLPPEEDWFTETIKIDLIRPKARLNKQDTKWEKVTIKGHTDLAAKVGIIAQTTKRKQHKVRLPLLKKGKVEILHLGATPTDHSPVRKESIIELSELSNENALVHDPLSVEIQHDLADNEYLIPFTFDGEIAIPVGTIYQKKTDKTVITIPQLPSYTDLSRETLSRSPQRAVWFSLLKFIAPKENIFQLSYIWKYENEQPVYGKLPKIDLQKKVKSANKILLLVHGIIGNTFSMAKAVQSLFESEQYSLILTFDYENLNTPIEEITEKLDQKLTEIGLGQQDKKRIDVIAHSMGGLVMRQLIERNRNKQHFVDRLLLFGTPNGGSTFSNLVKVRDTLLGILTIVASTSEYLAQPLTPFLYAVNGMLGGSKIVSTTLEQLDKDSIFIKGLQFNEKAPGTAYHIIAGDFQENNGGNYWQQLMDKLKSRQFQWIHGAAPSDLMVSVEQMQQVPDTFEATNHIVNCHHTNYFEAKDSLKILYQLLQ